MPTVVVPVRYPLSPTSKHTVAEAIRIVEERDGELIVLYINLYQNGERVTRMDLKRAVEAEFGRLPRTRYLVRRGFLVEEGILEELVDENADVIVIGKKQLSRWRRTINRLRSDPDIAEYLRERIDCEIVVAAPS